MTLKKDDWDNDENEVASNWVKFYVPVEDKVFGTLIAKRQVKSNLPDKAGELQWVYDLLTDMGSFHEVDDKKVVLPTPIVINAGEIWSVGGKIGIDAQMRNIKIGQKIGFKFLDEKPSKTKGFAPSKNIRIYAPKNPDGTPQMDEEWLKENTDQAEEEFKKA